jgi:hypothetical protein
MDNCELCDRGGAENRQLAGPPYGMARVCNYCAGPGASARVRARRAALAADAGPEPSELHAGSDNGLGQPRDTVPAPPPAATPCRECSRPERPIVATHGEGWCVYCYNRLGMRESSIVCGRGDNS